MREAFLAALIISCLAVSGCSASEPNAASSPAPSAGMGMGGGATGQGGNVMTGAVAASSNAALDVGSAGETASGIVVDRVLAPADGWVVVRSTVPPGAVMGAARVAKGVSRNVAVKLTAVDALDVRVALHVDRGNTGVLDFDAARPDRSSDRQVFVAGVALERPVRLERFGVAVEAHSASLVVRDQSAQRGALTLEYLLLPGPSWVSVRLLEDGVPGRQVGLASAAAGEYQQYRVPLSETVRGKDVVVALIADRGRSGRFEYQTGDPLGSPDQPYVSAGLIASQRARIK